MARERGRKAAEQRVVISVEIDGRGPPRLDALAYGRRGGFREILEFRPDASGFLGRTGVHERRGRVAEQAGDLRVQLRGLDTGPGLGRLAGAAPVAAQRDGLAHGDGHIGVADIAAIAAEVLGFGFQGGVVPKARLTGFAKPCGHVRPGRPDARVGLRGPLQGRREIERGVPRSRLCQRRRREESTAGHACKSSARPSRPGRFV